MRVGLDLLEISRFDNLLNNKRFLERVFTQAELAYILSKGRHAAESAAGIFCAKEAYFKAIGTGLNVMDFHSAEVCHTPDGMPYLNGMDFASLSISHTATTAAAVVVISN